MLKTLRSGLILSMLFSCSAAIIKEPQPVYVINTKFMSVVKGTKSFDVRNGREAMTEWVDSPDIIEWSEIPQNLIAFPLEIWLLKIKPALKALSQNYSNKRD